METDRKRGVKVGQLRLLPPPPPTLMKPVSVSCREKRLSRGATCQGRRASFPVLIGDQPAGLAVPLRATPVPHTPLLSDLSH